MLLVIDAGNTNVVMAVHDGRAWRGTWRISTHPQRTSDEYGVWLLTLLRESGLRKEDIAAAVLGTVVPAALYHLRGLCRDWFGVEPLVAQAGLDWGFAIRADRPGEVGADRLLNTLAGFARYGGPLIVIDFGTATTFDIVADNGDYCGGVIAPGIQLSLEALHRAAAQLPRIGIGRPQAVVGRSTIPAMQSGVFWGYVGLVEGIVRRVRDEWDAGTMRVVATGGLAPLLAEGTTIIEATDPDLTLEGLRLLAARNPAPVFRRTRDAERGTAPGG